MLKEEKNVLGSVSVIDALTQTLSQEIINGQWEPGIKLKDEELAKKYDVSRNSIREAFSILVEHGLLQKRANRGVFIPEYSIDNVYELYNARLVIELEAVEVLTKKRYVPEEMRNTVEALKREITEEKRSYFLNKDHLFHIQMVRALNNSYLNMLFSRMYNQIYMINRQPYLFFPSHIIYSEHQSIIESILSGDVANSRKMIREHIQLSIDRQIREIKKRSN